MINLIALTLFNRRPLWVLLLTLLGSKAVNVTADENNPTLAPFDARYSAVIKGFAVNAQRSLTRSENGHYTLVFTADSWAANIKETSVFTQNSHLLNTETYQFEQSALGKKKYRSLSISDDRKHILSHEGYDNASSITVPNTYPQVLDKLNYQMQLALDIAAGKDQLIYTVMDKGKVKTYRFAIVSKEVIESDAGLLNTVKIKMIRDDSAQETFIWLAQDWNYLLVQLQQFNHEKETLSIRLQQATVNSVPIKGL